MNRSRLSGGCCEGVCAVDRLRQIQCNLRCAAQCPAVVMESSQAAATPKLAIDPMRAIGHAEGSASNCVFGLPKEGVAGLFWLVGTLVAVSSRAVPLLKDVGRPESGGRTDS